MYAVGMTSPGANRTVLFVVVLAIVFLLISASVFLVEPGN
jgi:hypothetical protein